MQQLCRGRSARLRLCGKDPLRCLLTCGRCMGMAIVLHSSITIVQVCNGLERTIDKEEGRVKV